MKINHEMIGRTEEKKIMLSLLDKKNPELVMLTGRRRVGKTYIIEQVYKNNIVFSFTGTKKDTMKNQLKKFMTKLILLDKNKSTFITQKNWTDAFTNLTTYLQSLKPSKKKRVVFLDEFPWINSAKSSFVDEFGYWWNEYGTKLNIVVAISGSATTWMIKKIINNREGMHGRVTNRIHLQPFTLAETKKFVQKINPRLNNYDITNLYMCMGGIPLYLNQLQAGHSASQSIYHTCFKRNSLLREEFHDLYASLFDNHENYIAVVNALHKKWMGLTRTEIAKICKMADGGSLQRILENLESCNFILSIQPLQNITKGTLYRLVDEYSIFYLSFIEKMKNITANQWMAYQASAREYKAWQAFTFENICLKHADAIRHALGITGIASNVSSFYKKASANNKGFQIDLLIDRADNTINICEIKFYNNPIKITKALEDAMRNKRAGFINFSATNKAVFNTLITTFGLDDSSKNSSEIDSFVHLDALFTQDRFD